MTSQASSVSSKPSASLFHRTLASLGLVHLALSNTVAESFQPAFVGSAPRLGSGLGVGRGPNIKMPFLEAGRVSEASQASFRSRLSAVIHYDDFNDAGDFRNGDEDASDGKVEAELAKRLAEYKKLDGAYSIDSAEVAQHSKGVSAVLARLEVAPESTQLLDVLGVSTLHLFNALLKVPLADKVPVAKAASGFFRDAMNALIYQNQGKHGAWLLEKMSFSLGRHQGLPLSESEAIVIVRQLTELDQLPDNGVFVGARLSFVLDYVNLLAQKYEGNVVDRKYLDQDLDVFLNALVLSVLSQSVEGVKQSVDCIELVFGRLTEVNLQRYVGKQTLDPHPFSLFREVIEKAESYLLNFQENEDFDVDEFGDLECSLLKLRLLNAFIMLSANDLDSVVNLMLHVCAHFRDISNYMRATSEPGQLSGFMNAEVGQYMLSFANLVKDMMVRCNGDQQNNLRLVLSNADLNHALFRELNEHTALASGLLEENEFDRAAELFRIAIRVADAMSVFESAQCVGLPVLTRMNQLDCLLRSGNKPASINCLRDLAGVTLRFVESEFSDSQGGAGANMAELKIACDDFLQVDPKNDAEISELGVNLISMLRSLRYQGMIPSYPAA